MLFTLKAVPHLQNGLARQKLDAGGIGGGLGLDEQGALSGCSRERAKASNYHNIQMQDMRVVRPSAKRKNNAHAQLAPGTLCE